MKKYAIIVAGGDGNRAGGAVPKQFQLVNGIPMLWWSVRAFYKEDPATEIILVLHPGFFDYWDILYSELSREDKEIKVHLSCGGRSRSESVKNGLLSVDAGEDCYVAVHDAARPMVTQEIIRKGWEMVTGSRACIPVTDVTNSLRKLQNGSSYAVARKDFVEVQTPQFFECNLIKDAYKQPLVADMTDDASVVESAGHTVGLFEGSPYNIKVTNQFDIKIAELILSFLKQ